MKQLEQNKFIEPKFSNNLAELINFFNFKFDDSDVDQINLNDIELYNSAFMTQ